MIHSERNGEGGFRERDIKEVKRLFFLFFFLWEEGEEERREEKDEKGKPTIKSNETKKNLIVF